MSGPTETGARETRWILSVLLVAFVFCKAAGVTRIAGWSWWAVLSPLWVPALLVALVFLGALTFALAVAGLLSVRDRVLDRRARRAEAELLDNPLLADNTINRWPNSTALPLVREAFPGDPIAARESAQLAEHGIRIYRLLDDDAIKVYATGIDPFTLSGGDLARQHNRGQLIPAVIRSVEARRAKVDHG